MCGIAGFYQSHFDYLTEEDHYRQILEDMEKVQKHRGPDEQGNYLDSHFGLAHVRLSVRDLVSGRQPILKKTGDKTFGIVYNGELYNTTELKEDLLKKGWEFSTTGDTEVVLTGYMEYGPDFVKQMNGIFAFGIMDPVKDCLVLFRDRLGVKPLFYTCFHDQVIFSSEIKGLFAYPGVTPKLDKKGLNEIFSIGPAKTYGCGVFKDIEELLPAHYLVCNAAGLHTECYWKLESKPHTFDFKDNHKYFTANAFQPSMDRPFVDIMVKYLGSDHHYLECDNVTQADLLYTSVEARDLPAMADVDSSLLYFCSQVSRTHKVALTGECADEIFGGYPWFHKKECFEAKTFPWTMDLSARKVLLSDDFIQELHMDEYVQATYEKSVAETPRLAEDTPEEARRREIAWLNLRWFMQTLLDRMDRTSMHSGLEARVPFADHRIVEYLWNVPWYMKTRDGVAKHLLRESGKGLLPDEVLWRRKSPYPKTYDRAYEALLVGRVREILEDNTSPVLQFLDKAKTEKFLESPSDYGKPWYGQLMAGPQMLAYMIQVDYWLKKYNIEIV